MTKEYEKVESKSINTVGIWIAIAVLTIIALVLYVLPLQTNVVETRQVSEAYDTTEQVQEQYMENVCNNVNIKADSAYSKFDYWCFETKTECANTEQYCCGYTQECASYEQYCAEKNFWGNCIRFESRCASYKNVCNKQCTRCAGYNYPCTKYVQFCALNIKNVDDTGGYFTFANQFMDANNKDLKDESQRIYVAAQSTGTINFYYYSATREAYTCGGSITVYPTKQKCENVIKYRMVDKPVVKTRMVSKNFDVVKACTLWQRWTGRCV